MIARAQIIGANAERARSHNRQVVLGRIHAAGRIGRAEIARASGLSTQAVSNIIAELLGEGLILEQGRRAGGRGLPAIQYSLNAEGGYAVGIEIRTDAIFAALLNICGSPIASHRDRLAATDRETIAAAARDITATVVAEAGVPHARVLGAGVVMPGPLGATGIRESGTDLPIWDDARPEGWLSDALGLPVVIENDANAAALAERLSGVAKGLDSYAYLYFGNGLGLGMVQKGRLVTGAFGNAGEIGHIPVPMGGRTVLLEEAVSRLSVARHLRGAGVELASGADLARLCEAGNPALLDWLGAAAEPLSAAVTIIENLMDPEAVILGGAMPDTVLDRLIASVRLAERSVSNRPDRAVPRLMRGASGRMTATLGAAALVVSRVFTPDFTAAS